MSVAWIDDATGEVEAHAFPFDQGIRDKLDAATLFADLEDELNLPYEEWIELLTWLQEQRLVFHNAKFDLHMLRTGTRHWGGIDLEPQFYWDVMVVQRLLDPLQKAALKASADRLGLTGGDERDKEVELKKHLQALKKTLKLKSLGSQVRYDLADWDVIGPYAVRDAVLTILLWQHQIHRIDEEAVPRKRVAFQHDLTRTLYRMERRGVGYNIREAMRGAEILQKRLKELGDQVPFNPTLPGAKLFFFEQQGIPAYDTTPTGQPKLDDEITRKMVRDGVPWAQEWSDISDIQKALSMWYLGWSSMIGPDGRLRCSFKQTHVKTGRMSVERVQLQAIPKDDKAIEGVPPVKSLFVAKEGYRLWNLDISQAELRVASKFAGCKRMLEMLEGGADIHGITTQEIFGIGPEHPEFRFKRDIAKRLTFGGIFQIGGRKFQATLSKLAGIELSLQECDGNVQRWRTLYPEFGQAYYHYMRQAERQGWIEIIGHERSYFDPHRDYPSSAWNRKVQGSLAKAAMNWLIQVEAQVPGALVLTVHDSVVLELPEEDTWTAQEVAERGADMLTKMFGIQMIVDVGTWHKEELAVA